MSIPILGYKKTVASILEAFSCPFVQREASCHAVNCPRDKELKPLINSQRGPEVYQVILR